MKKYFYLMVAAIVCLGFTACGSDDDNGGGGSPLEVTATNLAGVWEMTHIKGSCYNIDDVQESFDTDVDGSAASQAYLKHLDVCVYYRYAFSGNTFTLYSWSNNQFVKRYDAPFSISGNQIVIQYSKHTERLTVGSLSDSQLVIIDNDEEEEYYLTVTMKRVQ